MPNRSAAVMRLPVTILFSVCLTIIPDLARAETCTLSIDPIKPIREATTLLSSIKPDKISKTCGFRSLSEIKKEADALISEFKSIKQFDLLFTKQGYDPATLASISERKAKYVRALRATNSSDQTQSVWKRSVLNVMQGYRNDPRLQILGKDYLLPDFSSGEEQSCTHAPACTSYGDFSVVLPPAEIEKISDRATPSDFDLTMRIIIGHEIGHYVHDIVFSKHASLPFREAMRSVDPERYHLLVDAISMELNHASVSEVIRGLTLSAGVDINQGDIPHRLGCWNLLNGNEKH